MRPTALRRSRLARSLALSLRLLAAHRLRTLLSVSGLVAGVASVMVMVAAGRGAERRVVDRIRAMGTDLLVVSAAPAARVAGRRRQAETFTTLRIPDALAIAQGSAHALAVAPAVSRGLVVRLENRNVNTAVIGTTPTGLRLRNMRAAGGRLFDEDEDSERRRVAVLGVTTARNLFGGTDPVGREIRLGNVPFDVIGVLRPRGTDVGGADLDNLVVIPLETAMRRVLNIPYIDALYVQAAGEQRLDALEAETREILRQRHPVGAGAAEPWVIQNQAVLLRTERAARRAVNRLTLAVSALALVVGGVGVLAVMLLSVRERVAEIGIRRAVGARRTDIRLQFLLESALLATAGGAGGVLLGLLASAVASIVAAWSLVIPWAAALLGLAVSTLLGLLTGVIPAARAAALVPADALRSG